MFILQNNRDFAYCVLGFTSVILIYYTMWVILLPFVEEDYLPAVARFSIRDIYKRIYLYQFAYFRFFPPIHLAFCIPVGIGTFISLLLLSRAFYLVRQDRREEVQRLKSQ